MRGISVPCVTALLATSILVRAQEPRSSIGQSPTFRSEAKLIQVDVVVTDQRGAPVTRLTANDFVLTDRRKLQQIVAFEEVSHSLVPSLFAGLPPSVSLDVADNRGTQANRLVVLLLDDLNTWQGRTERVRALARRVISDLGTEASMAVLFTSGDHGTEITSNRAALIAEIDKFAGRQRLPILASVPKCGGLDSFNFCNVDRIHKTLQDVSRMLSGDLTRRKAFVLLSEGVVLQGATMADNGIKGLFDSTSAQPCLSSVMSASARPIQHDEPYTQRALLDAMESMRRANVALYAIDPSAMRESSSMVLPQDRERVEAERLADLNFRGISSAREESGQFLWDRASFLAREYLTEVAGASGGFSLVKSDDFDNGFGRVLNELDHYYLLGFTPQEPGKGYRRLEISENRPGLQVHYRRGYEQKRDDRKPKAAGPLAALLNGALPQNGLSIRLHAAPLPGRSGHARVPVVIEVSMPTAVAQAPDGSVQDELQYTLVVVNLKTKKVEQQVSRTATMTLRPRDSSLPGPTEAAYQLEVMLEVAPGQYQIRASAISKRAGKGGSVYLPVIVPDFAKAPLAVSGLVLGYGAGARIPSATSGESGRQPIERGPSSTTLDRVFRVGEDLWVYCEVAQPQPRPLNLTLSLLDDADEVVLKSSGTLSGSASGVRLPMSLAIKPGAFRLRVTASDGTTEAASEIGIVVLPDVPNSGV